ncbi:MAG TPA: DUF2065 domain-containing protein [Rhodospirillales bacterium]|jgi:hypothetical protein|nr:DUF2065 domain-containing protein [Rhodospirillales bacterium]HJO69546.1 DUF2065 domain-containing protein [Rhodospirillales bacterium]|tara:strand:- start:79 stop:264 length:186 start_codon:yes stop_codon:yes gene_type:complete
MSDLLTGLALAIAIEGTLYALFPDGMKRMMAVLQTQPPGRLRNAGLVMAATGVGIVWLVRG